MNTETSAVVTKMYQDFLNEVPLPKRSAWFRFTLFLTIKLFRAGEWAGRRIANPKVLTPLEQMYAACATAGVPPDFFRTKLKAAFATREQMLEQVAKLAPKDGMAQ